MKSIRRSIKYFGVATLCFLVGVTSFHLHSVNLSEKKSIVSEVSNDRVTQKLSFVDSSRFYESIMVEIQDTVRRMTPDYQFGRAFCTCPGIISDQQSYSSGTLMRSGNFVAEVYIAESGSSIAAKKWMATSWKVGSERFLRTPKLEAVRLKNENGRDLMILIRIDRFVFRISGETSAVESIAEVVLYRLSTS